MPDQIVGSAQYELGADRAQLQKDLVAGEKDIAASGARSEKDADARAGRAVSKFAKIGAGAAGALGGALAVGVAGQFAQLDRAMADFQRETGASGEEAKKAGQAINDMAGRNIQPIAEIGRTLASVTVNWGLHGDAAAAAAEQVLKYAQATGQDAEQAVAALDDIQDNWNLTAADSQGIMDKLIVSHQRYGGSIEDNQKSLAGLAPAMRAANFQIDDGIALLGLFGSKGLDADQGAAAFAKALTKVKSPAELQQAIRDISETKDSFERASKAADLFGARAGAKLANALGGANLDDYKVSLEDAAGATDKAADASLTLADKVKMAFGQVTSSIIDALGPAGPALQAVSGLSSLLGPAIAKAGKVIGVGLATAIGAQMGPGIATQLAGALLPTGAIGLAAAAASIAIPVTLAVAGVVWLSEQHGIEEAAGKMLSENIQKNLTLMKAVGTDFTKMSQDQVRAVYFVTDALKEQAAAIIAKDGLASAVQQALQWDTDVGLTATDIQAINDEGDQAYQALLQGAKDAAAGSDGLSGALMGAKWSPSATKAASDQGRALATEVVGGYTDAVVPGMQKAAAAEAKALADARAAHARQAGEDGIRNSQRLAVAEGIALRDKLAAVLPGAFAVWPQTAKATLAETDRVSRAAIRRTTTGMLRSLESAQQPWKSSWQNLAAWAKDPFRPGAFEDWLKDRASAATRHARQAAEDGKPGVARRWREIAHAMRSPITAQLVAMGDDVDTAIAKVRAIQALGKKIESHAIVVTGTWGTTQPPKVPQHATGLAYVPYDGYIASLHRGERVLTAAENQGGGSGGTQTIHHVLDVTPGTASAFRSAGYDSGAIGQAIAGYMQGAVRTTGAIFTGPRR